MRQELDALLCARHPALFRDRHGDMRTTCMCWGFCCDEGWFELIDVLCAEIQRHADAAGLEVVAVQVKEKFGALCFYATGGDAYIAGLTWMAEALSTALCEQCGKPGGPTDDDWIKTRCPQHGGPELLEGVATPALALETGVNWAVTADSPQDVAQAAAAFFALPPLETERWRFIAAVLQDTLANDIRRNALQMIVIDEVIETEALAFRWHGGDEAGRARAFFRLVEAYSARV